MSETLNNIKQQLDLVASRDRFRLEKNLHRIESRLRADKPASRDIEKLVSEIKKSAQRVADRRQSISKINYPDLPISNELERIRGLLNSNQVLVIAGETGSGKTTQLPKICLDLGLGIKGLIGHTQPRRVAARSVASRIAEELESKLGSLVGYQVRFTDKSTENTLIKLMTDGILLSEIQRDPYLNRYECIIIDEAHERSLNIDFLLGYLKRLLPKRPDLKLIITSATIDVERFSKHFNDAPIVEVSGRTYPVEIFYQPWEEAFDRPVDAIIGQVGQIIDTEPMSGLASDILVFCTGERDIREAALALRRAQFKNLDILPLYSRLSVAEQDKIFKPGRGRRVVLATNVAETSLTVPGIGYVIDTGTARISRYSVRTKVQRLPIEPVSQASANQRAGRCGRIAEGVCIRLYSEQDFLSRAEFTPPEILRTNLASVILQMQYLRLGKIEDFPFVERPSDKQVRDGYRLLEELSLVNEEGKITAIGKMAASLPVDPRFARILWQAQLDNCLLEAITVVSALSIQDVKDRPADKQQQADERHRVFMDADSDFNAILNIWNAYQQNRQALSHRKLDAWCRQNFLSPLRMREWREVHHQLTLMVREKNWKINKTPASYKMIHRALLSGFLTQIGVQQENKEFQGTRNKVFRVFPGSYLAKKPPKWLFTAQMLDTSQLYAHQVAKFNSDWLLGIADHLLQQDYYEPYYHARRGEIMARMRYSLYGLVVSDHHKVSYKSTDPTLCRELFIREALANWKYRGKAEFYRHNKALCDRLQELEDRTRSRDLVIDEQQLYEFYEACIPADVNDLSSFESWRKKAEKRKPELLFLNEEELLGAVDHEKLVEFPDCLEWQGFAFSLSYRFEPGTEGDGVTMHVPVDALHQVPEYLPQWLVPGLLKDKLIALAKGLPKAYRKNLVPIPAHIEKIWPRMQAVNEPLLEVFAHNLKRIAGKDMPVEAWDEFVFDDFYLMRFSLEDNQGKVLEISRDLNELRRRYRSRAKKAILEVSSDAQEYPDSTSWNFGELPEYLDIKKGKQSIRLWPGLEDKGTCVGYKLFNDPYMAVYSHQRAVERLFLLMQGQATKYLRKELFKTADLKLMSLLGVSKETPTSIAELKEDLMLAVAMDTVAKSDQVRSEADMKNLIEAEPGVLVSRALELEAYCFKWADALRSLKTNMESLSLASFSACIDDIQHQLGMIFAENFLSNIPPDWRQHIERFIKGAEQRLVRVQGQLQRDLDLIPEIKQFEQEYEQLRGSIPEHRRSELKSLTELCWMLEEYRISLFSQPVKTSRPVSAKRLEKMIEEAGKAAKLLRDS